MQEKRNLLVFNCGSSSQGFCVFTQNTAGEPEKLIFGKARNVATKTLAEPELCWTQGGESHRQLCDVSTHRKAAQQILSLLKEKGIELHAIGHRFVNGGSLFERTARLDESSLTQLKNCLPLAPIHNPNSYSVIEVCLELLPELPQFAVFDTAFHCNMPEEARVIALPAELSRERGFHKVGFHGLSYQYVSKRAAALLKKPLDELRLVMCHLGSGGSSVCAMQNARSIDSSMSYSPLSGLIMSTRCGDLDPQIVLDLIDSGMSTAEVTDLLNHKSGLVGISGCSSNLAEIITAAKAGNPDCTLACNAYALRLRKYIGAFLYEMNGADAIIFTDDVGERLFEMREKVCQNADAFGIKLAPELNRQAVGNAEMCISQPDSPVSIWVIPTDEERTIYDEIIKRFLPPDLTL